MDTKNGDGYLKSFEVFIRKWHKLLATMPTDDVSDAKVLAKIMYKYKKIKHQKLRQRVDDRCRSDRDPNRQNRVVKLWRRKARVYMCVFPAYRICISSPPVRGGGSKISR